MAILRIQRSALLLITVVQLLVVATAQDSKPGRKPLKWEQLSSAAKQRFAAKALEQYAVYWTDEPGWHSELQLRNNLAAQPLTVTPYLRSFDGNEAALPPVTIGVNDVVTLNVHDLLPKSAPQMIGAYGSVVFRYQAPGPRAFYAAIMIHGSGHAIGFHLDAFPRSNDYDTGSREGTWWLPNDTASDYLILTNLDGQRAAHAQLQLFSADGKQWQQLVQIGARQTNRISIRSLAQQYGIQGSFGGIRVDMPHGAADIDTAHVLFDEIANFSAMMKMFNHDPRSKFENRSWGNVKQWTLRAPMLALTDPDPALAFPKGTKLHPRIFLRNTSPKSYIAQVSFNWRSPNGKGTSEPLSVTLSSSQTALVDVADLQARNVLPIDAQWASVTVSAPVGPEEFMAVAGSYDETMRYGAQTPFSDQLAFHWEGGAWHVDSTRNSLIAAGNGGDKSVKARLTLIYNEGKGSYVIEQSLGPGEQMWTDVAKLIRNQVPDSQGRTLPLDVTFGTYRLEDLTDQAVGNLYEGKLIVDKTYGHAAYGCMVCCGYSQGGFMAYDPLRVLVNESNTQSVYAVNSCSYDVYDITNYYPNWWTGNTNIATATWGLISGVAPGTTSNYAQGYIDMGDGAAAEGHQTCPQELNQATGTVEVDDFTVTNAQGIPDGGEATFAIAITHGNASSYSWSYTAPAGAGNSPHVSFTAPTSSQTNTDGHWFALPDGGCTASISSGYTLSATVNFQGSGQKTKNTQLTVNVPWNPAGYVDPNQANVGGSPDWAYDASLELWKITGKGTMARIIPTWATYWVPATSQFRHKTEEHEQVHLNNWIQGPGHLFGDLFLADDLYNLIKDLTSEVSPFDLVQKIQNAKSNYLTSQRNQFQLRHSTDEQQAYAVSDTITPQYLYQSGCPNTD